jgi:hypothetical protein
MVAAAVVAHRDHAATVARVVAVSKLLAYRVHADRKVKAGKGLDVADHRWVMRSPIATKAVLPAVRWASHVLPARHRVDSLTPCEPASI